MRAQPKVRVTHGVLAGNDVVRFGGLPVTSPVRTAFDLGRRRSRVDALVALDALAHRRVAKLPAIAGYAAARPRWPGVSQLRGLLTLAESLAESPMETRLRLLLLDADLPRPTAQHEVRDRRGRLIGRVDLAYPELRVALEYEGDHHRERAHFQRDVGRLNGLRAAGWLVLRFTADDVLRHPARVVGEVQRARHERRTADRDGRRRPST
jgi:very-short-patch-repair endonuclease